LLPIFFLLNVVALPLSRSINLSFIYPLRKKMNGMRLCEQGAKKSVLSLSFLYSEIYKFNECDTLQKYGGMPSLCGTSPLTRCITEQRQREVIVLL
jgi:hypothetical protein